MLNEKLLQQLEEIGWLDEMPAHEKTKLTRRLLNDPYNLGHLNLAVVEYDTECIYNFGPGKNRDLDSYYKIIQLYAENSWNLFHPTDIKDEYDERNQKVHVGFSFGKRFEISVPYNNDWFDAKVHDLINHALEANKIPQRFLILPVLDQVIYATFISAKMFEKAKQHSIFPHIEELLIEEAKK